MKLSQEQHKVIKDLKDLLVRSTVNEKITSNKITHDLIHSSFELLDLLVELVEEQ